jgi:hypothetical protein
MILTGKSRPANGKSEPGALWFIAPITARRVSDIVVGQLHGDARNDSG